MKNGIDVSKHNGPINWEEVKASGIEFAIIRAGMGRNGIDSQFVRNISECNRLNIPCGAYWFSYALCVAEAVQEAEYCIEAVKPYCVEYPICFDLEYDTIRYASQQGVTINKELASEFAKAFCDRVRTLGYLTMIYSNYDYAKTMFYESLFDVYNIWYAREEQYMDRDGVGLHQYKWDGSVPGISGSVDMNYSAIDYPVLLRQKGLNNLPAEFPIGDVNGDYEVTAEDYLMLKKIVLGSYHPTEEEALRASKIDDSGITSKAYLKVKKIVLGSYKA